MGLYWKEERTRTPGRRDDTERHSCASAAQSSRGSRSQCPAFALPYPARRVTDLPASCGPPPKSNSATDSPSALPASVRWPSLLPRRGFSSTSRFVYISSHRIRHPRTYVSHPNDTPFPKGENKKRVPAPRSDQTRQRSRCTNTKAGRGSAVCPSPSMHA
ncbi:hypothetical protein L226DRAFT_34623 [Lentinus tigrinus ALCF2SS1-7]|uniref:uncharacterized protein n=1 Tax=Lentinus tigrinus ALCF2SS1-7 TaxID=1328758 RepID=UPI001165CF0F|nr:hypothetical protein L226DRAFT_34623 [Lentinus tigrinus ALCF2SS1-7]